MIVVLHQNNRIVRVLNEKLKDLKFDITGSLTNTFFSVAKTHPDDLILWCHEAYFENFNFTNIDQIFHHPKMMVSYSVTNHKYLTERIGYVEDSPFINVKFDVSYPTWLMSSDVGGVHAQVLNTLNPKDFQNKNLDLFLNSVAKIGMPAGLLCYSNPKLLLGDPQPEKETVPASNYQLYRFVKEHYKAGWVFFIFLAQIIYERKLHLFSLIMSFFYLRKKFKVEAFSKMEGPSKKLNDETKTVDVIIPTLGRKVFLLDVLNDLAAQTILPKRVIIVEQNSDPNAISELDYLTSESWPFQITHRFIHQTGACNARNIAIKELESEWVFMADDDIRIPKNTIEKVLEFFETYKCKVVTLNCLREGDITFRQPIRQWNSFGSGCSAVASEVVKTTFFNMSFEHGFGEDTDYGMQLRNKGYDVLYNPFIQLKHLKAAVGGFRETIQRPWELSNILPKPSPTIMLYRIKHTTKQQLQAYKVLLFIKYYRKQAVKNPIAYIQKMNMAWNSSVNWANKLDKR
ncbi:MAG: glycosyltransferase involved in cell wall biosynthesis [Ulvibacter sp.]|jgi:glycosyltransferase involved in cell wall biosynthesis